MWCALRTLLHLVRSSHPAKPDWPLSGSFQGHRPGRDLEPGRVAERLGQVPTLLLLRQALGAEQTQVIVEHGQVAPDIAILIEPGNLHAETREEKAVLAQLARRSPQVSRCDLVTGVLEHLSQALGQEALEHVAFERPGPCSPRDT